jgi:N-ethylmaleimide reductase
MTSLTRIRCDPKDGVPTELVKEYYTQRAGAGMILTEASAWTQRGHGFPGAGNLYTQEQAEGWRKVVDAVHAKGSRIYVQLIHCGRTTSPVVTGMEVWGPSAVPIRGKTYYGTDYAVPKEMTIEDIK